MRPLVMTERVGSHGDAFWREEFPLMSRGRLNHDAASLVAEQDVALSERAEMSRDPKGARHASGTVRT